LKPSECGIIIGKCGHVFHDHCKQLNNIIYNNPKCLECNNIFKKVVFIKPTIDSKLNELSNKNYIKYIKYIKNNEENKIKNITESSKKANKTKWYKKLNNKLL
jgi:hypothetical protein